MSDSQPPPSEPIPGAPSGTGLYIAGILLLAGATGGLLYWRFRERPPQIVQAPVVASARDAPRDPIVLHAPPPPPPLEALGTAAAGANTAPAASAAPGGASSGAGAGACSACGSGEGSDALTSALQSAAAGARGCYNRALRTGEVSGSMTVSVQVGSNGAVCGATVTKDTVGSGEIASCVLGKFRGRSFPAPQSGCVVVNIPIKFEIQQ